MNDLYDSAKTLAAKAREERRPLKVETLSGSIYHLAPLSEGQWMIHRIGVEGQHVLEIGTVHVKSFGNTVDLYIGSWTTTGLRSIELVLTDSALIEQV